MPVKSKNKKAKRAADFSQERKEAIDFLVRKAINENVRFIRIWFTDILGFLKSFAITIDELERSLTEGMGLDGSSIESFARSGEHDMIAIPDLKTFQVLPWRPKENAVARMFADIHNVDGTPFEGDPRYCLRRNLQKAASQGFTFYVSPELEYFYFRNAKSPEVLDEGVTGFIVENPDEAVSAVKEVSSLSRKKCREVFEERFIDVRMAKDYLEIYEKLIRENSKA